ncbi:MAG TPA: hypothetical protein VF331_16510 [Polyangiales bacterium]
MHAPSRDAAAGDTAGSDAGGSTPAPGSGTSVDAAVSRRTDGGKAAGAHVDAGPRSQPPKTYAELCPNSTPGVGIPAPVGTAQPVRTHPLYEYLESPVATAASFGLSKAESFELIENQPDPAVYTFPANDTSFSVTYSPANQADWPVWLAYAHDDGVQTHTVTIAAGALTRGTYHVTVPLWRAGPSPAAAWTNERVDLQLVVRVSGLGFTADRLPVPHYVGDALDTPLRITLAGWDAGWRITDAPAWLRIASTQGTSLGHLDLEIFRLPALDDLGPGHYEGRLCVENARGDGATIPVYALVERPRLRPLHSQRYLYNFASSEQLSSYTYIFTDLREQGTWRATSSQPWLKLARAQGATNERLDFTVDPTGLPEGRHTAELDFSDPSGKNDDARVIVYYLKDQRLSTWLFPSSRRQDAVSPVSPHAIELGTTVTIRDLFSGDDVTLPDTWLQAQAAAVSKDTQRLYVIGWGDSYNISVRSYSWPELTKLSDVASGAYPHVTPMEVVGVLGQEYLNLNQEIVNVTDGRTGPMVRTRATLNQERLRIYDDGSTIFGFWEDVGVPSPNGLVHWARGPNAVCAHRAANGATQFQCEDEAGVYLTLPADLTVAMSDQGPLFTHQGGLFIDDPRPGLPDAAFSATGQPIALLARGPVVNDGRQWGDTLLMDDKGGHAFNYLFEPGPAAVERTPLPTNNSTCPGVAGQVIASQGINATALVADPARDRLYAAVGGSGLYAGELVTLSGSTGAVLSHVDLGGTPSFAAINDEGSTLFVVLGGPDRIRSVDLTGAQAVPGVELSIPAYVTYAQAYLTDIAVARGTTDTVVVTRAHGGDTLGTSLLYIGGILRDASPLAVSSIAAGPFGLFFAVDGSTGTQLLRVQDRHLNPIADVAGLVGDLHYQDQRLVVGTSQNTVLFDVSTPQTAVQLGTLPVGGAILPDTPHSRLWALNIGTGGHAAQLDEYSLATLSVAGTSSLDGFAAGYPTHFVRTASGCFAYVASSYDATNVVLFAPP